MSSIKTRRINSTSYREYIIEEWENVDKNYIRVNKNGVKNFFLIAPLFWSAYSRHAIDFVDDKPRTLKEAQKAIDNHLDPNSIRFIRSLNGG